MNKPTTHRINWDDNATLSSPLTHTDTDTIDTTEDEDIDEFRRRSPGNRSPVTFYIESECSKVGTMSQIFKVDLSSIYIKIMRLNLILCIFVEFVKNVSFKWCQTL